MAPCELITLISIIRDYHCGCLAMNPGCLEVMKPSFLQEKDEFVDSILEDAKRLGADISQVTYTSNYFDKMLDLGERLIRAGHLYADDTPQEKMKEARRCCFLFFTEMQYCTYD